MKGFIAMPAYFGFRTIATWSGWLNDDHMGYNTKASGEQVRYGSELRSTEAFADAGMCTRIEWGKCFVA